MKRIWSYLFTTANPAILNSMLSSDDSAVRDFGTQQPLAGLGYGLPISRNYARYFNGDLTIMSIEGYGTDSYIYLPRLQTKKDKKAVSKTSFTNNFTSINPKRFAIDSI